MIFFNPIKIINYIYYDKKNKKISQKKILFNIFKKNNILNINNVYKKYKCLNQKYFKKKNIKIKKIKIKIDTMIKRSNNSFLLDQIFFSFLRFNKFFKKK